jgi:hypothetical protein
VNTCRLTIEHHPETDQCQDHMVTHTVHIDPINVNAPDWILRAATKNMCADRVKEHDHFMPEVSVAVDVMTDQGIEAVVVLAPGYWDIEDAFWSRDHSRIANKLRRLPAAYERPIEQTAVVIDLGSGTTTLTSCERAEAAK